MRSSFSSSWKGYRYSTSSPLARATSACTLSLVMKSAFLSTATARIMESISPDEASFICSREGRFPVNSILISPLFAISLSSFNSSSPLNPVSRPLFACASSSATSASAIITAASLYPPSFNFAVILPSMITLVSGTMQNSSVIIIRCTP
ncbi:Uncharacterised protein [uncultured archaeon]|nr:Uncharacterised protein [uncultured archaeon]